MTPFWVTAFLDDPAPHHDVAVAFWAAVTGSSVSTRRGATGEFATLVPPSGDPWLRVQRLDDGPARVHLDLHVPDPRAAADRAVSLGATVVADHGYITLTSPAGVVFCVVVHPAAVLAPAARWPGGRSQVDQVCVDAPPSTFDAELTFWEALTGWSRTRTGSPEFERLDGDGMPLRMLLQRLDDEGPAGVHLDLSADDREAEVARHVALGATLEGPGRGWTVLADPAGRRYCVTDRKPR